MYAGVRAAIRGFAKIYWRLRLDGTEHLPPRGGFILASVHRSNIDSAILSTLTPRRMRYMGKESMWRYRAPGWLFDALGGFPVRRDRVDRSALRRCVEIVEAGDPLVIFPEGTRRPGPLVEAVFDGPAYVATRTGVPIVPVGIGGSEQAMPRGSALLRPVKVCVVVGEPLQPPAAAADTKAGRRAVRELSVELRRRLQLVFDEARVKAGAA